MGRRVACDTLVNLKNASLYVIYLYFLLLLIFYPYMWFSHYDKDIPWNAFFGGELFRHAGYMYMDTSVLETSADIF